MFIFVIADIKFEFVSITPFESPDVPDVYETVKISELSFYWAKAFASSSQGPF